MLIGFDAKRAVQNVTGLGNYSRYLIESLLDYDHDDQYVAYAPKKVDLYNSSFIRTNSKIKFTYSQHKLSILRSYWRTWGVTSLIEKDGVDLYHGLSNELPLNILKCTKTKKVVTIHDLIYLRLPQYYNFFDRKVYDYKYRQACINADLIFAVSNRTKKDIVELYNIDPEKIRVIYQGCDEVFGLMQDKNVIEMVKENYSLPKNYLLFVGSIEDRKNALTAVKALAHLPEEIHLVLIGKRTPYVDKIISYAQGNGLSSRLHIWHGVPLSDLPSIYQGAKTFIYPSLYEGFGIPIIEAICSKLPVVAATGSCLEEAGGPDSLYVEPLDDVAMAKAIEKTLDDEVRTKMVEAGQKWLKNFDKRNFAIETKKAYYSLFSK